MIKPMSNTLKIAVFISGTGSNLASILKNQDKYHYQVVLVVSNKANAKGLEFAKQYDVPVFTFKWDKKDTYLTIVQNQLQKYHVDLLVLAGFMRILPSDFINSYKNRIINIHPSLLPKYKGLHTHQQVIDNNDNIHGATVHYVTAELDAGKIIAQVKIKVPKNCDADTLAAALLFREHSLFPYTIGLIAENRVQWRDDKLYFDGKELNKPIQLDTNICQEF
ncbi:MAG TPA: phosphoribosylglycinamide formyltransferase [Oceanospirillales bacterium]|nr:phosphoribosylglycinamide formyltransferase [Oceanospirillales bacterium]